MPTAFIVRVARTAAGKRNGALSHYHPAVLGAKVVDASMDMELRCGLRVRF